MKTEMVVLMCLVLLGVLVDQAESACCTSNWANKRCGDGTIGTPCCGYRKCNLFCCACGGGCRKGRRRREVGADDSAAVSQEDQEEDLDQDVFKKYDADGDGKISVGEARRWLIAGGCGNPFVKIMTLNSEFSNLDADNDGALDRAEIGG